MVMAIDSLDESTSLLLWEPKFEVIIMECLCKETQQSR